MINNYCVITLFYMDLITLIQRTIELTALTFTKIVSRAHFVIFLFLSSFHKFFFQRLLLFCT